MKGLVKGIDKGGRRGSEDFGQGRIRPIFNVGRTIQKDMAPPPDAGSGHHELCGISGVSLKQ